MCMEPLSPPGAQRDGTEVTGMVWGHDPHAGTGVERSLTTQSNGEGNFALDTHGAEAGTASQGDFGNVGPNLQFLPNPE